MTTSPLPDFNRDIERVSPEIVRRAWTFAAAILADVAGRRGTLMINQCKEIGIAGVIMDAKARVLQAYENVSS